jgi:hypothetical protein
MRVTVKLIRVHFIFYFDSGILVVFIRLDEVTACGSYTICMFLVFTI